ncbi:hypothetical protein FI667_g11896, partial [Globisporangium splendens]
MAHTSLSAADGNDALCTVELLDFIDKLDVFTESERLAGARAFPGTASVFSPVGGADSFLSPALEEFENAHVIGDVDLNPDFVGLQERVSASNTTKQTLMAKKRTSCQRQREEIAYLRDRVQELEGTLESIKSQVEETGADESAVAVVPDSGDPVDSVWATIAKRQLEQKNRAKVENLLLRERLVGEIRFVRSLKRMLRKRKDSDIFEMLTRRVDERVRTLGVVSDAQGFTDGNSSYRSPPNIYTDDEGGVKIHLSTATTVPFDFQKVADIVWMHLRPLISRLACDQTTTHVLHQTEDTLVKKEMRPFQLAGDIHQTTARTVCKRVIQKNRVVMLWEKLTETRGPCGVQCIQVRFTGCGELLRGEVTANGSPSTLVRSTQSFVPHMVQDANTSIAFNEDGSAPKVPKRKSEMIGLLSELLIASHQQHTQTSEQFIENALFDDLLRGKNSSL